MNSRAIGIIGISGLLICLASAHAFAQKTPSIPGLPGPLTWQNAPRAWNIDSKNVLTISSNPKTDWFVDPFDGTVAKTAPILLFTPGPDYVLSVRVAVQFTTKLDAGALMLWGDDHHWAKLSYEFSPDQKPTLVTVVTPRALRRLQFPVTRGRFGLSTYRQEWQYLRLLLRNRRKKLANPPHV